MQLLRFTLVIRLRLGTLEKATLSQYTHCITYLIMIGAGEAHFPYKRSMSSFILVKHAFPSEEVDGGLKGLILSWLRRILGRWLMLSLIATTLFWIT